MARRREAGSFNYLYGPVSSWRLGSSLGIDPLSQPDKVCSFDCVYCQLRATGRLQVRRQTFVTPLQVIGELRRLPPVEIDYVTFSGRGEPCLAANLGSLIRAVKRVSDDRVAVITNSSLLFDEAVRADLCSADLVVAKLDACTEETFMKINRPAPGLDLETTVRSLRELRSECRGRLALQVMLIQQNLDEAEGIARLCAEIGPDQVQLNTPLRPCAVQPLPKTDLQEVRALFPEPVVSVYDATRREVSAVSGTDTLARRGKVAH